MLPKTLIIYTQQKKNNNIQNKNLFLSENTTKHNFKKQLFKKIDYKVVHKTESL